MGDGGWKRGGRDYEFHILAISYRLLVISCHSVVVKRSRGKSQEAQIC